MESTPCSLGLFFVQLAAAHSLLPESAGSRSPEPRRRGIDVVSKGSAQPRFVCGALVKFDCRQTLCCTAEWWRRECAGEAGRSRRPRRGRVSGAGLTRIRQTGMERPAVGAAGTVRWPLKLPKPHQTGWCGFKGRADSPANA